MVSEQFIDLANIIMEEEGVTYPNTLEDGLRLYFTLKDAIEEML